jgi:ABC-type sugar transport system ATPase subunit
VSPRRDLLEVRGVSKTFPGLKALDDVSLTVGAGEIVALVGQNGSGKSTLVKILAGVHTPDPGAEITLADVDGDHTSLHFIHQDLGLVGTLSTVENLDLGRTHRARVLLGPHKRAETQRASELIAGFDGDFDVKRPVNALTPAERTIVAVARALDGWDHPHNMIIFDEPTASLHGDEVDKLFAATRRLAERGAGVVFISHRLDEVIQLADRVVCLRDGKLVANVARGAYDHDDLVELIAGKLITTDLAGGSRRATDVVMRARGLTGLTVDSLDIDLHAGEILGISGVIGSGREAVAGLLSGATVGDVASLKVGDHDVGWLDPRRASAAGVAYVPGDRHRHGAVMTMSARENLTLPRLAPLRRVFGRLDQRAERAEVAGWLERLAVRPPEPERRLDLFSGGNQQKVVLAKWLRTEPKVFLLDEPTRGVDVGAKSEIFALLADAAAAGAGVLICSSDAKELTLICDRVMVMRDGRAVAEITGSELSEAQLVRAGMGAPAALDGAWNSTEEEESGRV